jgi:predicted aconitase with swiveling domain
MHARILFDGAATGRALVLSEPLSLWGGLDPQTGVLIDAHHPQRGAQLAGRVIVMASSRGSSSSSSVLAEAVRSGHSPAAILLGEPDLILAVGAAVAAELYDERVPILVLRSEDRPAIRDGMQVRVTAGGVIALD